MYTDETFDGPHYPNDCQHGEAQYVGTIGWHNRTTREKQMLDIYCYQNASGDAHVCVRHGEADRYMSMPLVEFLKCKDYDDPAYAVSRFLQEKGNIVWARGSSPLAGDRVLVSVEHLKIMVERCKNTMVDELNTLLRQQGYWAE